MPTLMSPVDIVGTPPRVHDGQRRSSSNGRLSERLQQQQQQQQQQQSRRSSSSRSSSGKLGPPMRNEVANNHEHQRPRAMSAGRVLQNNNTLPLSPERRSSSRSRSLHKNNQSQHRSSSGFRDVSPMSRYRQQQQQQHPRDHLPPGGSSKHIRRDSHGSMNSRSLTTRTTEISSSALQQQQQQNLSSSSFSSYNDSHQHYKMITDDNSRRRSKTKSSERNSVDNSNFEDPDAVSKAILELREKREQAYIRRMEREQQRNNSNSGVVNNVQKQQQQHLARSTSYDVQQVDENGDSIQHSYSDPSNFAAGVTSPSNSATTTREKKPVDKYARWRVPGEKVAIETLQQENQLQREHQRVLSPLEQMDRDAADATKRLQSAENRILHLQEDLDDLKFLKEIEQQSPTQQQQHSQHSETKYAKNFVPEQQQQQQQQRKQMFSPPPRPKLPKKRHMVTPREVSKLDRTELELEVQTLIRDHEILNTYQTSLLAEIDMYEMEIQSHEEDNKRIRLLEESLSKVKSELKLSIQSISSSKEQLTRDYEEQISKLNTKLNKSNEEIKSLSKCLVKKADECQELQDKIKIHTKETNDKLSKEASRLEEIQSSYDERIMDLQEQVDCKSQLLEDCEKLAEELTKDIQAKEADISKREQATKIEYESRIEQLSEQLNEANDNCKYLETECERKDQAINEKQQLVDDAQLLVLESTKRHDELSNEILCINEKCDEKVRESKRIQEEREAKRLNELVIDHQEQVEEYERRLVALQEQLTLSRERHHNDIEQKEAELQRRIQDAIQATTDQVTAKYEPKIKLLETELNNANDRYEQMQDETIRQQLDTKDRDRITRDYERKESLREIELQRVNDKLDCTIRELSEKDDKINELHNKLMDTERRNIKIITDLESQQTEQLTERDDLLSSSRQRWKTLESKLRTDLAKKDAELVEMQEAVSSSTSELQDELLDVRKELAEAKKIREVEGKVSMRMNELQASLIEKEKDLATAQARHEELESDLRFELAKLEGKLLATESSMKEKRFTIEQLEERLSRTTEEVTSNGDKHLHEISELKRLLDESRELAVQETNARKLIDDEMSRLKEDQKNNDLQKLETISKLEETVATLTKSLEEAQAEKLNCAEELSILRTEQNKECEKLCELQKKYESWEKENANVLTEKEKEFAAAVDKYTKQIGELDGKLQEQTSSNKVLQDKIDSLKTEFDNSIDQSVSRRKDDEEKVKKLEKELDLAKQSEKEISQKLEKISNEKNQVDKAVEELLSEISHRDEELDDLTEIIEKRDSEIEHAKLIATKAIASAEEIKIHYEEKNKHKSNYKYKVDELTASVDYLTERNDKLKTATSRLESELHEKNLEIAQLRDSLLEYRQTLHKQKQQQQEQRETALPPRSPARGTARPSQSSFQSDINNVDKDGFIPLDEGTSQRSLSDDRHEDEENRRNGVSVIGSANNSINNGDDSLSTNTANAKWLHDFDSDNSSFASRRSTISGKSDPTNGKIKSRRSIERAALQKYVRKRYSSKNQTSKANDEVYKMLEEENERSKVEC